jgi:hypothetical protein
MQKHMGGQVACRLISDNRPIKKRRAQAPLSRENISADIFIKGRFLQDLPPSFLKLR